MNYVTIKNNNLKNNNFDRIIELWCLKQMT